MAVAVVVCQYVGPVLDMGRLWGYGWWVGVWWSWVREGGGVAMRMSMCVC